MTTTQKISKISTASRATLIQAVSLSGGLFFANLADRVLQFYLLSMIVLSGPSGEGLGLCTLALLAPDIAGSIVSIPLLRVSGAPALLFGSALVSMVVSLGLPFILGLPATSSQSIIFLTSVITALSALRAVARVTLAPELKGSMSLQSINSLNWAATILASACALYFMGTASVELLGVQLAQGAAMLYLLAVPLFVISGHLIKKDSEPRRWELFQYLRKHKWSRSGVLSISILSFASLVAYGALTSLAIESFQGLTSPLLLLIGSLCLGLLFGCVAGAFIVPNFKHRSSLIALGLSISALGAFLLSPVSMAGAKSLLIIFGTVAAGSLVTLDTVLQKIVPRPLLGAAAGLRNAFTTSLLVPVTIYCERLAPVTSATALVRVLAAIALSSALVSLLPIGWRHIRRAGRR